MVNINAFVIPLTSVISLKNRKLFFNPLFLSAIIIVFVVYSGLFKIPRKNSFKSLIYQNEIIKISGELISSPMKTSKGNFYSSKIKVHNVYSDVLESSATGEVNVFIPSDFIEAYFPGRLYSSAKVSSLIESGSFVVLEGSFSEGTFFARNVLQSFFESEKHSKIKVFRAKGRLKFKQMMYSWGNAGGLLLALLSGAREYTENLVSENFRKAGLSHILALSGMHLSMFSGLALFLGGTIGRKRITLILQLCAISTFVWFAGFSPSLLRAFICVLVVMIQGILALEKSDMISILSFSFFVQTVLSPNDLNNTGFILSYGALCGILLTGEFFRKIYSFIFPGKIASSLASSSGAQLITLPVSAKLFGVITPIGIISSVFISPLVTLFIYSGLVLIILGLLFSPFIPTGEFIMGIQYNFIKNMVGIFAKVPPIQF